MIYRNVIHQTMQTINVTINYFKADISASLKVVIYIYIHHERRSSIVDCHIKPLFNLLCVITHI